MMFVHVLFFPVVNEPDILLAEHSVPGRLRAAQDLGHRIVRAGDAGATQSHQGVLCHEDSRQAEGKSHTDSYLRVLTHVFMHVCNLTISFWI